jgi:Beta-lactamase enzyme family
MMKPSRLFVFTAAVALFATAAPAAPGARPLAAQTAADSTPVLRRLAQVAALFNGAPIDADTMFAKAFLAQVPAARLVNTLGLLAGQTGRVARIELTDSTSGDTVPARARFVMSKPYTISVKIQIASTPPHLITGLLLGVPTAVATGLKDIENQLLALHGQVSFLASRVDGNRLVPVAEVDSGRALAIGSAFKLYVLAQLVQSVAAGQHHWTDLVRLDSTRRSLPSGVTQSWPAGAPVTVQTLATLMISQSDNTAADALLHLLERENVERAQQAAGNTHAARNEPFLSTREMFLLKSRKDSALAAQYASGGSAARRQIVAKLDAMPQPDVNPDFTGGPVAIDSIEWFASAADLSRTMLWLREHTASPATAPARAILAVNPGLSFSADEWPYVGFKGGSEPGVLDLTLLLRDRSGTWYVVSAAWNDPAKAVDEGTLVGIVQRAVELLGKK